MKSRVWVNPNDSVDLTPSDIKSLGPNLRFMKKIAQEKKLIENKKPDLSEELLKKLSISKPVEKKEVIPKKKKVLTRAKNNREIKTTIQELRTIRSELKIELESKNKGDVIAFAEEVLKMDIKWKDKKGIIITKILSKSKNIGYKIVLKKIKG